MADVTDAAFRRLIARHGKPDVMWTEFVSTDGLCSDGRPNLLRDLRYDESERPIVAQFFGTNPEHFRECGALANELGFDGIDINMGCPVKIITKTGSGAQLINNPQLAQEIILATKEGAGRLPVSVKTRIGWNRIVLENWMEHLVATRPAAIILHLRTAKEMSEVEAHWEVMRAAVQEGHRHEILMLGNGDVRDLDHADQLVDETGADGIMLGRAVFGNPWLFNRERRPESIPLEERFEVMIEHARLFIETFDGTKNFKIMRKHLRAHASGFPGAKDLRIMLEEINSVADVERVLQAFREKYPRVMAGIND
jgi:nifR3 family TIM-barrel protein